MKIIHAMFSRGNGGIEQSFVLYSKALESLGYDVINLIHPDSKIASQLPEKSILTLSNYNQWDIVAIRKLRHIMKSQSPSLLISHGKRANLLLQKANKHKLPHMNVLHRYRFKHLKNLDRVICVTNHLKETAKREQSDLNNLVVIPNMIDPRESKAGVFDNYHKPPVIGFLGRFVPEKGVDILIDSLYRLKQQGISFTSIIAGDGPERPFIEKKIHSLGLEKHIELVGWVQDRTKFFNQIDILTVPSRFESFGMSILEGFYHGRPVIASKTPGPQEIIHSNSLGVLFNTASSESLADSLHRLMSRPDSAKRLIKNGLEEVEKYSVDEVAKQLKLLCEQSINAHLAA